MQKAFGPKHHRTFRDNYPAVARGVMALLLIFSVCFVRAQSISDVRGTWRYADLTVTKTLTIPHYTTALRPAPGGRIQIIINDDSSKIQYTVGSSWVTLNGTTGAGTLTPGYGISINSTTIALDSANVPILNNLVGVNDSVFSFQYNNRPTQTIKIKGNGIKYSDSVAMLAPYLRKIDTTLMLAPYLRKVDTATLSARINLKINISDSAAMLATYLRKIDTATLSARINLKVNISDTAAMLVPYARASLVVKYSDSTVKYVTPTQLLPFVQGNGTAGLLSYWGTGNTLYKIAGVLWDSTNVKLSVNGTTGTRGIEIGANTMSTGSYHLAVGAGNTMTNQAAQVAFGIFNNFYGLNSQNALVIGISNLDYGNSSLMVGQGNVNHGNSSGTFGDGLTTQPGSTNQWIFGRHNDTTAFGADLLTIGNSVNNSGVNSTAFGIDSFATLHFKGHTAATRITPPSGHSAFYFDIDSQAYVGYTGSAWVKMLGFSGGVGSCGTCLLAGNNLSDVASASASWANLGGGASGQHANSFFLQSANNGSDIPTPAAFRTNIGLGTAAVQNISFFLQAANNGTDIPSPSIFRSSLGLGALATKTTASLTADVSGILPIANGGMNRSTAINGIVGGNGTAYAAISITPSFIFSSNTLAPDTTKLAYSLVTWYQLTHNFDTVRVLNKGGVADLPLTWTVGKDTLNVRKYHNGSDIIGAVNTDSSFTLSLTATGITPGSCILCNATFDNNGRASAQSSGATGLTNNSDVVVNNSGLLTSQSLIWHLQVQAATDAALATNTYFNGTAGVGATITSNTNLTLVVAGYTPAAGERVLVNNESDSTKHGIYIVTQTGSGSTPFILTRGNFSSVPANMAAGSGVYVINGTNAGKIFLQTTTGTVVFGTTKLAYNQYGAQNPMIAANDIIVGGSAGIPNRLAAGTTHQYLHGGTLGYSAIDLTADVAATVLPIANGGTNATTANGAVANLLPAQSGKNGFTLATDGTNTNWTSSYTLESKMWQAMGSTIKATTPGLSINISNASSALAFGVCRWVAIYLPNDATLTGVTFMNKVVASYTANNENRVGLYSVSGGTATLVASSTNNSALFTTAIGVTKEPFTTTYNAVAGLYYIAIIYNRSAVVTGPSLGAGANFGDNSQGLADFSNGNKLFAQTTASTLPSTQTITSLVNVGTPLWVGVY